MLSGRTGKRRCEAYGDKDKNQLGYSVAGVGDVDGDGVSDYAQKRTEPWVSRRGLVSTQVPPTECFVRSICRS